MKKSDVDYLARLSSLILTPEEAETVAEHLSKTLEEVKKLKAIDTAAVAPTFQTSGNKNRFQKEKTGERSLTITAPFIITTHHYEQ